MTIRNKKERQIYLQACEISVAILKKLYDAIEIGQTPLDIDNLAFQLCQEYDVKPAFYGVEGYTSNYEHATCVQVNDEVVHAIPTNKRKFREGDLISVDFGINYEGFYTDHCFTVGLGQVTSEDQQLLMAGRDNVLNAIKIAKAGVNIGDLGYEMYRTIKSAGFEVAKQYVGHGIGKHLHESPEIPAFGVRGDGPILQKGMIICVESQVLAGKDSLKEDRDGWTIRTRDGKNSVMFEYIVEIDHHKAKILTPTADWPLIKIN